MLPSGASRGSSRYKASVVLLAAARKRDWNLRAETVAAVRAALVPSSVLSVFSSTGADAWASTCDSTYGSRMAETTASKATASEVWATRRGWKERAAVAANRAATPAGAAQNGNAMGERGGAHLGAAPPASGAQNVKPMSERRRRSFGLALLGALLMKLPRVTAMAMQLTPMMAS